MYVDTRFIKYILSGSGPLVTEINLVEEPAPESGLSSEDIKDVIVWIISIIERVPETREILGFLLEDVPEEYRPSGEAGDLVATSSVFKRSRVISLGPRVNRADKERAARVIEAAYNAEAESLNQALADGSIGVDTWYEGIRKSISRGHVSTYSVGRSGAWSSISFSEWGRLGQRIRRQNQFLQAFADDIRKRGAENISVKYLNNRTGLYGANFRESLEAGNARDRGLDPSVLPAIPGDGTTQCLVRCKCRWTIRPSGRDRYLISWRLGQAEHCATCNSRARDWVNLEVYKGNLISEVVPHYYNR